MKTFFELFKQPLPEYLIRHFEEKSHAEEFIRGNIRLGFYRTYTTLRKSDVRHNAEEGKYKGAVSYVDGTSGRFSAGGTWPLYIVCFFDPSSSDTVRNKHGKFAVKIRDPLNLYTQIGQQIGPSLQASWGGHMVYGYDLVKTTQEELSTNLLPLSVYTDSSVNKEKKEIRFSYYVSAHALLKTSAQRNFEISSETIDLTEDIRLPKYVYLKDVPISRFCELIEQ
ncbi:MAG: hypothetical protein V4654_08220 [Bdellovibrionota bacterium]